MNRILKIAENNVEVTPSKIVIDTDNQPVSVWDEESKESYGQEGVNAEKAIVEANIATWESRSADEYGLEMIAIEEAKLERLILIQEAMNG